MFSQNSELGSKWFYYVTFYPGNAKIENQLQSNLFKPTFDITTKFVLTTI